MVRFRCLRVRFGWYHGWCLIFAVGVMMVCVLQANLTDVLCCCIRACCWLLELTQDSRFGRCHVLLARPTMTGTSFRYTHRVNFLRNLTFDTPESSLISSRHSTGKMRPIPANFMVTIIYNADASDSHTLAVTFASLPSWTRLHTCACGSTTDYGASWPAAISWTAVTTSSLLGDRRIVAAYLPFQSYSSKCTTTPRLRTMLFIWYR